MFKLYDIAFKIGFFLFTLLFVYLNLISYINRFELVTLEIRGPDWGYLLFLVSSDSNWNTQIEIFGLFFNLIFYIVGSFIVGLIFHFSWSKIKQINSTL
jgi:hypothetical protein